THIVMPSWDTYLDDFARSGLGQLEGSFIDRLHQWAIPPWLRPVPYQLPTLAGFENQSVVIFEVVEEQDPAVAASRLAEYFVEVGQLDRAANTAQALRRFPADLGAWVARAQVEIARGDEEALANSFKTLLPRLAAKGDRTLPWDRRVSLAVVLARGKHADLAREQVRRCVAEIDEAKLRSLTTGSLYRLMVLSKGLGIPITDEKLHALALELLPGDWRARLQ
ncbi:MAG TPA: hypothetical protein VFJ90_10680, partial [Candidatus Didemnitutus sp.]|nr:hypothetical protein [Candidatus Didemnitutus sp.]